MMDTLTYGLGRWAWGDERDKEYPMRQLLKAPDLETPVWWEVGQVLNQGSFPHCVAYAWKQLLQSEPIRQGRNLDPVAMYTWCQKNDEWPGENYDGTSVRAGAKFLKNNEYLAEYRWAEDAHDVVAWLQQHGPVVLGTAWFSSMSSPRDDYVALPEGSLLGGHAYLVVGYEPSWEAIVCVNSWGTDWGKQGVFYLWLPHLDWLIKNKGEACVAVEQELVEKTTGSGRKSAANGRRRGRKVNRM